MSRSYEFRIMVRGYKPERVMEICAALQEEWDFDPSGFPGQEETPPEELNVSGVDNLTGGLAADDMADRLAQAVWAANGAYCEVEVWSTFMDVTPPSDTHTWNADDYQAWIKAGGPESHEQNDHVQAADGVPGA